jgi:hypothetical protein
MLLLGNTWLVCIVYLDDLNLRLFHSQQLSFVAFIGNWAQGYSRSFDVGLLCYLFVAGERARSVGVAPH